MAPTVNPTGYIDVPYDHYEEAAFQTGISPGVVVKEAGFSAGLADLCDNSSADYATLVEGMRSEAAAEDDPVNALGHRLDEVDLRVALACSYRMADWMSARGGAETPEGLYPDVTPTPDPPGGPLDDGTAPGYDDYEADYTESHGDAGDGEAFSPAPEETATGSVHVGSEGSESGSGTDGSGDDGHDSGSESGPGGTEEPSTGSSDAAYHDTSAW